MKNKIFSNFFLSVSGLFLGARTASAAGVESGLFNEIGGLFGASGPAGSKDIGALILQIVQVLLVVAASIAVIFLMVGGYRYVVARGNEEGIEEAKKTITGAVIGLVVIVMSFAVIRIISAVLLRGTGGLGI